MTRFTWIAHAALLLILICPPAPAQTTIHVDDDAPNDPGPGNPLVSDPLEDGSADHPFDAIQEAIDAAPSTNVTVLVADGFYDGEGNRSLDTLRKGVHVRSANGPEICVIDCKGGEGEAHWGFKIEYSEYLLATIEGFTIKGAGYPAGATDETGSGVWVVDGRPTIRGNIVTGCSGRGIHCVNGTVVDNIIEGNADGGVWTRYATIVGNTIRDNTTGGDGGGIFLYRRSGASIDGNLICGNTAAGDGGGIHFEGEDDAPVPTGVVGNRITGNVAGGHGGGVFLDNGRISYVINTLVAGNEAGGRGGGFFLKQVAYDAQVLRRFINCTIAGNTAPEGGGGIWAQTSRLEMENCIFAGNESGDGANLYLAGDAGSVVLTLDHSLIQDAAQTCHLGPQSVTVEGPLLTDDPDFCTGPEGEHYLSQVASGQAEDSPALDAGVQPAAENGWNFGQGYGSTCLDELSTRTDGEPDDGMSDLGYHYPGPAKTVSCRLEFYPELVRLPGASRFTVELQNNVAGFRRFQYQIDFTLENGVHYWNWRRGWLNVPAGQLVYKNWRQDLPLINGLKGNNRFVLSVMDVTPAPYNQPPYPPSGDTDTGSHILFCYTY